jgi:phenylpyruvate tautomerase PptA (4-oxalocrotonate tautomerase family)
MPVAYIDLPSGLKADRKRKLVKDVAISIDHAYMIPDTRVILREWPDQVSVDGRLGEARTICNFCVPPGLPVEQKRQFVQQVSTAIADACNLSLEEARLPSGKKVSTRWVLSFLSEYPLEQAALDDLMAFENPMVLEAKEAAMQMQKKSKSA